MLSSVSGIVSNTWIRTQNWIEVVIGTHVSEWHNIILIQQNVLNTADENGTRFYAHIVDVFMCMHVHVKRRVLPEVLLDNEP